MFTRCHDIKIDRWTDYVIDVLPAIGGKDIGVQKVMEYYDLNHKETIGFGDATNDIPLLKSVGIGICMGNGKEEVKQIADYVTDSVDENGLYNALKKYQIIK